MSVDVLSGRTISAFPLSIGTSLAFESIFDPRLEPYDPAREIVNRIDIRKYNQVWVNLATLFRNALGAVPSKDTLMVGKHEVRAVLESEMETIQSLLAQEGQGFAKPVFYFPTYETPSLKVPHNAITVRKDTTDQQKHHTGLLISAMKSIKADQANDVLWLDHELTPAKSGVKALVLSHVPYDLLSWRHFDKLDLLESHTGKLKPRSMWYTKYLPLPKEDLSTLPFQRKLLMIFGDKIIYHPLDIRFRKLLLGISRDCKWTPMTTDVKVMFDLDRNIKERYLYDMFKSL